jgi:hypothetical protein
MKFNTVNITRLALYCSANEKPIFLENKSFIGYYEEGTYVDDMHAVKQLILF